MRSTFLILLAFAALSCSRKPGGEGTEAGLREDSNNLIQSYPELADRIDRKESTEAGNYFKLTISTDSTCRIEWGNRAIRRTTRDDYHFHIARRFRLEWESRDFLTLRAGTGSGAWFSLVLPLDSFTSELTIHNSLARSGELVVAEQLPGTDTIMYILNLKTHQIQYVTDEEKCEAFYHSCLDTLILSRNNLYYSWSTPHKYMDNPRTVQRNIEVKI